MALVVVRTPIAWLTAITLSTTPPSPRLSLVERLSIVVESQIYLLASVLACTSIEMYLYTVKAFTHNVNYRVTLS